MQSKQTPISGLHLSAHMHLAHSLTATSYFCGCVYLSPAFYCERKKSILKQDLARFFEIISQAICLHVEQVMQEAGILRVVGELSAKSSSLLKNERPGKVQYRCFKILRCFVVFIFHGGHLARELNTQLEGWLSKVYPTCRPAKAIIAP